MHRDFVVLKALSAITPALVLWFLGEVYLAGQSKGQLLEFFLRLMFLFSPYLLCIFLPTKYMGIGIGAALLPAVLAALALLPLEGLCMLSNSAAASCMSIFLLMLVQMGVAVFSISAWIKLHIDLRFVALGGAYSLVYLPFAIHMLR
jgi:hypothetical protein